MVNKRVLFGKFEYLPKNEKSFIEINESEEIAKNAPNKIKAFVLLNLFKNGCSTIYKKIVYFGNSFIFFS